MDLLHQVLIGDECNDYWRVLVDESFDLVAEDEVMSIGNGEEGGTKNSEVNIRFIE